MSEEAVFVHKGISRCLFIWSYSLSIGRIDACEGEDLLGVNALFPFNLTYAFLPQSQTTGGPVELVIVGSRSADISIPRLSTYARSKVFLYQLTRCLNADERYGSPLEVRFM
ncbi:hypothetical protein QCA50_018441 [Cerrena zonata]|uniref:Uncharacterized protein n=1 Tax=Cerrena zonata TaxID=2478898 RepID=A0AAW0FGC9_9APHY